MACCFGLRTGTVWFGCFVAFDCCGFVVWFAVLMVVCGLVGFDVLRYLICY